MPGFAALACDIAARAQRPRMLTCMPRPSSVTMTSAKISAASLTSDRHTLCFPREKRARAGVLA
eukprot:14029166-Alexandrium_andersonii.AAC.1